MRAPRRVGVVPEWDAAALRVLAHAAGPLKVLGGPGTGKTTLLLAAVAGRVAAGEDPARTLLLVGSRRAAGEFRERLADLAGGADRTLREPLVRTVHSYAFGVLRLHAARHGDPPPRLLAGAEQDAVVRDLLAGELFDEVPGSGWPDRLRPALALPGFAAELRELILRAAERGLGPDELAGLGELHDVGAWSAAGRFFRTYEQVTLLRGAAGRGAPQATAPALDAAELVSAALDALASDPELLAAERHRVQHLLVDDAQDLDPQQMELVRALGSTARTVLLAGDPDQAVLNFRGADPTGMTAIEADTVVLGVDHRSAPAVRAAGARLAARLPGAGPGRRRVGPPGEAGPPGPADLAAPSGSADVAGPPGPADVAARSGSADVAGPSDAAEPPTAGAPTQDGVVDVRIFASAAQEAGWVADRLRRAHLTDGVPWSRMAVLSRSTRRSLPTLRRALLAAGVPIAAPPDELPTARQPAVVPLLMVLRYAARPQELDADAATALLTSPLGSADPMRMRRLRRGLLRLHAGGPDAESGEGSDPLLVDALRAAARGRPDPLSALPANETAPLRRVGALLALAGEAVRDGESAEEVLWRVWQRCGLGQRWSESSARGGPAGAAADRDLDAVLALFDAAARHADRLPGAGVVGFTEYLTEQHLPSDSLAARAPHSDAVVLLTAHAARGREWDVVAVPGVQEGAWPDLRLRGSLLGNERLVDLVAGVAAPQETVSRMAPLLAEERRLFYSACTRARTMLLVSGVQGEDEQPSRFLDELDPLPAEKAERAVHRPGRSLVLAELVGELRRAVCDPVADPARHARAAASLARLAEAGVPGAHPDQWYGLAPLSAQAPLREPGEVVPVSPSDVEKILRCPLRWVLERHGGSDNGALAAITGSLVHALVQAAAAGAEQGELETALQAAWARLDAGAPWFGRRELVRVRGMLAAFDEWVRSSRADGLRLVAVEQAVQLDLPPDEVEVGTPGPWLRLRGRVDRLEADAEGRPVVIDVKTGKTAVSARAAAEHPQLAVYQLAAALGAFGDLVDAAAGPGGARLVYVADRKAGGEAKEPAQPPLDEDGVQLWRAVVRDAGVQSSGSVFVARLGPDCDRCPVHTSCPAHGAGRPVTEA
ncbi:ATP-dependent helicase [Pseudonocardia sp. KRD-169]|uniref:DNA 3'-5' helicase n=1 Tax=Pseudonocardia abyssalis TaxID=2792008 RepID=A0ABS6UVU0_9PSEU|nr:ATP-dependent helicase [Pseudonocardia abyssalis]MBW0136381.1 ATP-dependent helicase [Pseudonocardia abyssalis]